MRPVPKTDNNTKDGEKPKDEYKPVSLKECLDIFTAPENVELTCPSCSSKDGFSKQSLFKTLPNFLAVNARHFALVNWVPQKLDVPVVVGGEPFQLDSYMSKGPISREEQLPEDGASTAPKFTPNESALAQLEGMSFPRVRCEKALHATGNADAEAAMNWLFAHVEDPDIDTTLNLGSGSGGDPSAGANPEAISMMEAMGIGAPQARKALKETNGDVERAVDWVFNHPDDQGDFGQEESATDAIISDKNTVAGNADLPATFRFRVSLATRGRQFMLGE